MAPWLLSGGLFLYATDSCFPGHFGLRLFHGPGGLTKWDRPWKPTSWNFCHFILLPNEMENDRGKRAEENSRLGKFL